MTAYILGFLDSRAMGTVWWVLGVGGIGGIVLLCLLYPVIMQAVLNVVGAILREMLSTRLGCAVLAAIVVGLGVSHMRGKIDNDAFADRTAQFEQQQKQRDAAIAAETREQVTKELADLKKSEDATDTAVKDFTDAAPISPPVISPLPATDPLLVGADACKLRIIAGLPACGSERRPGVSGARKRAARTFHHVKQQLPSIISRGPGSAPQGQ